MPNETIDFGIMEKSDRVAVVPMDVGWSDVGNWSSLLELLPSDRNQNVVIGDHIGVDTQSTLIYSSDRMIATVGLENMIVVDTGDVVLVCHREDAQKVKHLVDELGINLAGVQRLLSIADIVERMRPLTRDASHRDENRRQLERELGISEPGVSVAVSSLRRASVPG